VSLSKKVVPRLSRINPLSRKGLAGPHLERLELHVSHVCNLTCESCSHYSNQGHRGNLDLAQADAWMSAWSHRITVGSFCLLGGEPTIHPELSEFIPLVRRHWPQTRIEIVTNGLLLARHPDLPRVMAANGEVELIVSVHHDSEEYRMRVQPVFDLTDHCRATLRIRISVRESHKNWTRRYLGVGDAMTPFEDEDPRRSWEICPARQRRQLFEGKLWKCSPIAYLAEAQIPPIRQMGSLLELPAFGEYVHESGNQGVPRSRRRKHLCDVLGATQTI
jgi:organic radical activating enzyme